MLFVDGVRGGGPAAGDLVGERHQDEALMESQDKKQEVLVGEVIRQAPAPEVVSRGVECEEGATLDGAGKPDALTEREERRVILQATVFVAGVQSLRGVGDQESGGESFLVPVGSVAGNFCSADQRDDQVEKEAATLNIETSRATGRVGKERFGGTGFRLPVDPNLEGVRTAEIAAEVDEVVPVISVL